jgi:hypothetical protein
MLPVILCECEMFFSLREEHKLRVFEKDETRILEPKKEQVMWSKLWNEFHNLCSSQIIMTITKTGKEYEGNIERIEWWEMHTNS